MWIFCTLFILLKKKKIKKKKKKKKRKRMCPWTRCRLFFVLDSKVDEVFSVKNEIKMSEPKVLIDANSFLILRQFILRLCTNKCTITYSSESIFSHASTKKENSVCFMCSVPLKCPPPPMFNCLLCSFGIDVLPDERPHLHFCLIV